MSLYILQLNCENVCLLSQLYIYSFSVRILDYSILSIWGFSKLSDERGWKGSNVYYCTCDVKRRIILVTWLYCKYLALLRILINSLSSFSFLLSFLPCFTLHLSLFDSSFSSYIYFLSCFYFLLPGIWTHLHILQRNFKYTKPNEYETDLLLLDNKRHHTIV